MRNEYRIEGKRVTQKQWYDHLEKMYMKQEPYAELGKLAIKAIDSFDNDNWSTQVCDNPVFDNSRSCKACSWQLFCQKRAELLVGEQDGQ